ncbi:MAG: patatin-like phospholipase family protein [Deltaproteobacteria bacterium]|nr:patatin-like phospholipase family protein [Deltaproteobacteria bacterium]
MLEKNALVLAPLRHTFDDLCAAVARQAWLKVDEVELRPAWRGQNLTLKIDVATTVDDSLKLIAGHFYNLVVVDCRNNDHPQANAHLQQTVLFEFLDQLVKERDRERRFPMSRVAILVGDVDVEVVEKLIFRLGQRHVGACIRDRSLAAHRVGNARLAAKDRLVEQLWQFCNSSLIAPESGKKAVNLAGGGLPGIYYELGVLKCLNDALGGVDVRDFELFFGVGAGAVVAAFLANGVAIADLIRNIGDVDSAWPESLEVHWRDLNLSDIPRRLGFMQKNLVDQIRSTAKGARDFSVASLVSHYGVLFGPMFDNRDLERMLRAEFTKPKRTNDFRRLRGKLFIGATDQDRRHHVLFGEPGLDDVPVSVAVQASTATHPYFPSVQVRGRYYTDGSVTRTGNINAAIQKGATLLFVVDAAVPLIADEPGFNARQGNLWLAQQDFKTLAYTRFEQVSEEILRRHPQVSCYTFVPSNRMRELMTQSPIANKNFHQIVTEAYASTYRRLSQLEYKLARELESFGLKLDLKPVATIVEELARHDSADAAILLG